MKPFMHLIMMCAAHAVSVTGIWAVLNLHDVSITVVDAQSARTQFTMIGIALAAPCFVGWFNLAMVACGIWDGGRNKALAWIAVAGFCGYLYARPWFTWDIPLVERPGMLPWLFVATPAIAAFAGAAVGNWRPLRATATSEGQAPAS